MAITDPMVLPVDVVFVPVTEMPERVRSQIEAEDGDWAITRPRSRAPSRIVDARAAELLREFEKPKTIVQAVIHYSRANKVDPDQTLEEAFPLFQRLVNAHFLVEAGSSEAGRIQPTLEAGERFAGCEVLRSVQALEDVELYQVRRGDGETAALKVARAGCGAVVEGMLRREAGILAHLDGAASPRLLVSAAEADRVYLLLEWCPGMDASLAAAELHRAGGAALLGNLLQLCRAVVEAYARLHEQHVVHGDVHPRNVLVSGDNAVKLVDFGLARISGMESEWRRAERGGVGFFFEPEYAESFLHRHRPPASSMVGEQYGIASLVYSLMTGSYYLDFSLERHEMLRQIAEEGPLPFARRGLPSWPELEQVLGKALSKRPEERFATVGEFAAALGRVTVPHQPGAAVARPESAPVETGAAEKLLRDVVERCGQSGELFGSGVRKAPTVSLNYGSLGIAYAMYRIACAKQDAALLSLADLWASRGARDAASSDAFYSTELEITEELVGRITPYHTASGVPCVQALIARAMDDVGSLAVAVEGFMRASRAFPCENLDITLGRSSTILGCALLLDALSGNQWVDTAPLVELGNETLEGVWKAIDGFAPIRECKQVEYLGAAHGWAGLLYAAMRWSEVSGAPLPSGVEARLEQLAACAEPAGEGVRWRWGVRSHRNQMVADYMAGWCNGSAGFVFTWTLAHQLLGEARYLELAEKAAWNAWELREGLGNLCCGLVGQAYALLNVYRKTGEAKWLERARELGERAALSWRDTGPLSAYDESAMRRESLYKGELGVAVLAADLAHPEYAAMPFYESEGWRA